MRQCSKCFKNYLIDKMMVIESEGNKYFFCSLCLREAKKILKTKLFLTKEERKLLKDIRVFLRNEKTN